MHGVNSKCGGPVPLGGSATQMVLNHLFLTWYVSAFGRCHETPRRLALPRCSHSHSTMAALGPLLWRTASSSSRVVSRGIAGYGQPCRKRCSGAAPIIAVSGGGERSVSPNSSTSRAGLLQGHWRGISSTGRGARCTLRVVLLSVMVVMRCSWR